MFVLCEAKVDLKILRAHRFHGQDNGRETQQGPPPPQNHSIGYFWIQARKIPPPIPAVNLISHATFRPPIISLTLT